MIEYSISEITNRLFGGDNLYFLKRFPDECVDLITIDPLFRSGTKWKTIEDETQEVRTLDDTQSVFGDGSMQGYLDALIPRIKELYRILKPTGSFYLHCDSHASHYIKVELDKIFGFDNFQNDIIWRYGLGGSSAKRWQSKHDDVLFYTKGNLWTFNPHMIPSTSLKMKGEMKKDDDVWYIPNINNMAKERLDYPTQKPEAVAEMIINASSNEGDIVLDSFMGSGTSLYVAKKLGRKFIGIDHSRMACEISAKRLGVPIDNVIHPLTEKLFTPESKSIFRNRLMEMEWFQLQEHICQMLGFKNTAQDPNKATGSDGGKDGIKIVQSDDYKGEIYLAVEATKGITEPIVKGMFGTIINAKNHNININRAIMVGWKVTIGSKQLARDFKTNNIHIICATIDQILDIMDFNNISGKDVLHRLTHEIEEEEVEYADWFGNESNYISSIIKNESDEMMEMF